eukprot:gene3273-5973_t
MRLLDLESTYNIIVLILPLMVCGYNPIFAIFAIIIVVAIGIYVRLFAMIVKGRCKPQLESITYSHYVERVRWVMDILKIDYDERQSAGVLGLILQGRTVPRLKIPAKRTCLGDSGTIIKYLWASYQGTREEEEAAFLKMTPEVLDLERKFDHALGLHARRWLYYHVLKVPQLGMQIWGANERSNVPMWQRIIVRKLYQPLRYVVIKLLQVNRSNAIKSLDIVKELYDEIDQLLADGRRYVLGDHLTIADISLASLGALTVFPPNYTGGVATQDLPSLEEMRSMGISHNFVEDVQDFRKRKTGKHILRLYKDERLSVSGHINM